MRRLPLLVLLCVTLDFANPLMPGAVRFEAGSVEFVQADRATRAATAVVPAPAALGTSLLPPDGALARSTSARPVVVPHPVRRDVPRGAPRGSDASPSPMEDH